MALWGGSERRRMKDALHRVQLLPWRRLPDAAIPKLHVETPAAARKLPWAARADSNGRGSEWIPQLIVSLLAASQDLSRSPPAGASWLRPAPTRATTCLIPFSSSSSCRPSGTPDLLPRQDRPADSRPPLFQLSWRPGAADFCPRDILLTSVSNPLCQHVCLKMSEA